MNSIIINIGNELLSGDILNTNSTYISKKLREINIQVSKIVTIGDSKSEIADAVKNSLKKSKILILTGGLGPTDDDLTREGVAEAINEPLIIDENLLINLRQQFNDLGYDVMPENNKKQTYVFKNSMIMNNPHGTAPGVIIKRNGNIIVLLPGPPKELKPMFENHLIKILKSLSKEKIYTKTIRTIGIGESSLEEKIKPHINNDIIVATYANKGMVDIKVTSLDKNIDECKTRVNSFISNINIDKYIYGYDNDTLESIVFKLLEEKNLKIGFCESLTGGLISSNFTKLSGISKIFPFSIITYSNESKMNLVNVKKDTLRKYGAVSKYTAKEMARGLLNKPGIDIALSVTGIAGPTGGSKKKPVGLVYVAIAYKNKCIYKKFNFHGFRSDIQIKTSINSFNELRKLLLKL